MRRLVLAALSLALLATACQPATTELTEEQRSAIAAEVDSVVNEWWTSWSTMDFDRGLSFFADDPDVLWMNDAQPFYTKSGVDELIRPWAASLQRQDVTPIDSRTIVVAPDVVYTIRINTVVQVDTAGNALPEIRFAETIVWVQRDGEWKVLIGHGSTPSESM